MKTVLITGASRGIGAAIAREFAKNHYNLILNCMHSADELEILSEELRQKYHANCISCIGDVGDLAFVEQMFTDAKKHFGVIDVIVNNAGISHIGLFNQMSVEEWNHIVNTNLNSVFYCCKCAISDMLHQKSGKIINISSVWGVVGASCEVAYSATKGAINTMTMALAKELAPSNIQVNAIACGTIDTQMNACFTLEEKEALESEIPCGRYGRPEEVAELAYSLATSSSYLTGQVIRLDGGWI